LLAALALTHLLLAAPACGPLGPDEALALAARNGDEVAIRNAELAAAEADLHIAQAARFFPIASATVLGGLSPEAHSRGPLRDANGVPVPGTEILNPNTTNRSLRGLSPFVRTDVNVIQPLYTWGRLDAAHDAATAGVKAREKLVSDKLSEVRVRIAQLFWGETLARRLLAIAADVEKNLAQVDQKLDELLKEGEESVKPADRYRLDVYKATLRKRKADAQKGLELAHGGLAATLGLAPEALTLRDVGGLPLVPGDAPDLARARDEAKRQRPDVAALDQAIAARGAEARAARGAMLPQVFAAGTFSWAIASNRDTQLNPWINDEFNHLGGGVALGLRQDLAIPLLLSQAEKARAEGETLRRQREGLGHLVEQQVEAAVAEVQAARERLSAASAAVSSARSWFRSAGLDFEAGVGEPKDLLDAYAAYIEVQVDQQQSAYDLVVARAKLDQAAGEVPRVGPNPCGPGTP
jgi:outer membrane protein TolC